MILARDINLPDDSPEDKEVSDKWKTWQRCGRKFKEGTWKDGFLVIWQLSEREAQSYL